MLTFVYDFIDKCFESYRVVGQLHTTSVLINIVSNFLFEQTFFKVETTEIDNCVG